MHHTPRILTVLAVLAGFPQTDHGSAMGSVPIDDGTGLFAYRFEKPDLNYVDVLSLTDGTKRVGKVMEWADQVLLFSGDGAPTAFDPAVVGEFVLRRSERHVERPNLPDLTVAWVERLPRDPSVHGLVTDSSGPPVVQIDTSAVDWRPKPGQEVTFRIHVVNAGGAASPAASCRVAVDDRAAGAGATPPLEPGAEHVVEVRWAWQEGPHVLSVELAPDGGAAEIVRWNNRFSEPIHGQPVAFAVSRARYEAFRRSANLVDSFCIEDWIQYHVRTLNALFAASVHPSAPRGVVERVRCDRIMVVDDVSAPDARAAWSAALRRGGGAQAMAEYAALVVIGPPSPEEHESPPSLRVDWRMLQAVGRDLGLIDPHATDTTVDQCLVLDKLDAYAQRRHLFPHPATFMYTPGGYRFSEQSAGYLNRAAGLPRGVAGEYLYQVPARIVVEALSNAGRPLQDVLIDVFQLMSDGPNAGTISGVNRTDPILTGRTDAAGRLELPNRPAQSVRTPNGYELKPNPFGVISRDGSNGLLLLRLREGRSEEFHFLRLYDCNVAFLRGDEAEYVHRVSTRFGGPEAPPPPDYTAVVTTAEHDGDADRRLEIRWRLPEDADGASLSSFNVYKRTSFAGEETKPWRLVDIIRYGSEGWKLQVPITCFDEFRYDGPYGLDTFYAVSTVDRDGRESGLSPGPACITHAKEAVSFAIDDDHHGFITLTGPGEGQILHWTNKAGTQPAGLRHVGAPGYRPSYGGLAATADRRLVIADPANHVVAVYDRGDLVGVIPKPTAWPGTPSDEPGRFAEPIDVAVDADGRWYVAERGNDRVQIVDSGGAFSGWLDEGFAFRWLTAIAYSNGHVCVTDRNGVRCRVYDVSGGAPKFVRELPLLVDAHRALVSKSGRIYVTARAPDGGQWAVLLFKPDDESAVLAETLESAEGDRGDIDRPRGLYLYTFGEYQFGYFVNGHPFNVRRIKLE